MMGVGRVMRVNVVMSMVMAVVMFVVVSMVMAVVVSMVMAVTDLRSRGRRYRFGRSLWQRRSLNKGRRGLDRV